jgi:hypothetical protein
MTAPKCPHGEPLAGCPDTYPDDVDYEPPPKPVCQHDGPDYCDDRTMDALRLEWWYERHPERRP